jgi:transcriptional regulator with XRE-family HTH domain
MAVHTRQNEVRERRLGLGISQSELAGRAGVSRQLVAAVEGGRNAPSVEAALALAGALGCTVEGLFGRKTRGRSRSALGQALPDGAAVRVGRVGEQLVAAELPDHGIAGDGWARGDAVVVRGEIELFPDAEIAGTVVAGCDPAMGVAEAMLAGRGRRSLLALSAPTGESLAALEQGAVHAAVVHDRREELPEPEQPVGRVHLARWQVGLAVSPGVGEASLELAAHADFPLIQRPHSARSQRAFERALGVAGLGSPRTGPIASGHLAAARAASLLRGAAVTTEGAARAFGLRFLALEEHIVQLWVAEQWLGETCVQDLVELLGRPAFTRRVAQFGGYDLADCGTLVSV